MQLKTGDHGVFAAKIELGETLFIEFNPDATERVPGMKKPPKETISFTISTMTLPGDRMALSFSFPSGKLYRVPSGPFVLCDITGFSRMTIEDRDGGVTELEKAE